MLYEVITHDAEGDADQAERQLVNAVRVIKVRHRAILERRDHGADHEVDLQHRGRHQPRHHQNCQAPHAGGKARRPQALSALADDVYMDEKIEDYIVNLVEATRNPADYNLNIGDLIRYGASPRATIFLTMAARRHSYNFV